MTTLNTAHSCGVVAEQLAGEDEVAGRRDRDEFGDAFDDAEDDQGEQRNIHGTAALAAPRRDGPPKIAQDCQVGFACQHRAGAAWRRRCDARRARRARPRTVPASGAATPSPRRSPIPSATSSASGRPARRRPRSRSTGASPSPLPTSPTSAGWCRATRRTRASSPRSSGSTTSCSPTCSTRPRTAGRCSSSTRSPIRTMSARSCARRRRSTRSGW